MEKTETMEQAGSKLAKGIKRLERRIVVNNHHKKIREAGFNPRKRMNLTEPAIMRSNL